MYVNAADGTTLPVTTDTQDSFTVFHAGLNAWNSVAWTRVAGQNVVTTTPDAPVPILGSVAVVGTVSATIPDNTPVLIRGLDSSSAPQTFAALPNVDGNHTIQAVVNATDYTAGGIRPCAADGVILNVVTP